MNRYLVQKPTFIFKLPFRLFRTMSKLHNIELNATERKISSLLLNYCNSHNASITNNQDALELRITGGWVRDKLLGKESNDLDIAINVMSGVDFATQLLQYAHQHNVNLGEGSTSLHTIKKNPDKSKHLETCTTRLFGLDIDFVNLRNEQYTEDSRVPVIECGTAEEDALRRDATLNALFYNLNLAKVEDFTQRGLQDLQDGVLRTPLRPLQTFLDDPLRVLRLIRFACRFNFSIEEEAILAMKDDQLRQTLIHKISRERVGVEVDKILTSDNVAYGLRLINDVHLTESIFNPGALTEIVKNATPLEDYQEIMARGAEVEEGILNSTKKYDIFLEEIQNYPLLSKLSAITFSTKQLKKLFWECVVLAPYGKLRALTNPKKNALALYTEVCLKEGLRFGKFDYDNGSLIVERMANETALTRYFADKTSVSRADIGMYIRNFGDQFGTNVLVNLFTAFVDGSREISEYEEFLEKIIELGLEYVAQEKPIVDGKQIAKALDKKPGPWMSRYTSEVMHWQLDHPECTAHECLEHLKGIE